MAFTVNQLAALVGGEVRGDGAVEIHGAASAEDGKPGDLSFVLTEAHLEGARRAQPSCLIAPVGMDTSPIPAIACNNPKLAFAIALQRIRPLPRPEPGVHPTAAVDPDAAVAKGAHIAAQASVGAGAHIEDGAVIGAGSVVEDGASVGRGSYLHPRVVIGRDCVVGADCILHSGVVLGSDGYGYVTHEGKHEKFPQIGNVIVGDDVEIGANCAIDRGALGSTRIGSGTKIDNLTHLAHNVEIGEHCLISAQVGIAGSSVMEDHAMFMGQGAMGDHARVGRGAIVLARSGVPTGKIVQPGKVVWGAPARPVQKVKEQLAAATRLPALLKRVAELEKRLRDLEED